MILINCTKQIYDIVEIVDILREKNPSLTKIGKLFFLNTHISLNVLRS